MLKVNKQDVTWTVASQSDSSMYLRHDIGLLYENGYFKGVQSKWKEQTLQIDMSQSIPISRSSMFKAISYHHGENHNNATLLFQHSKDDRESIIAAKKDRPLLKFHGNKSIIIQA